MVSASSTAGQIAALVAIIATVEALVIGGRVVLALRALRLFRTSRLVRRANRMAAGVMIGVGAAVAVKG